MCYCGATEIEVKSFLFPEQTLITCLSCGTQYSEDEWERTPEDVGSISPQDFEAFNALRQDEEYVSC